MPSVSKQQQKFMGMVHALKKGEMDPTDASPAVKKVAQSMSDKDAKDFASTSHKGLPKKVKQEILNKLKEYANSMGRDHLGGDDYTSSKKGGLRDFDGYDNVDYNKDMPMDESINEFLLPRDVDSKMKELGINKIPISSQGEKILKGMVKEKFLDKVTNADRLIYFYQSLGDARFGYGIKGKPLSPLVDRFSNDLMSDSIFFGGKLAAYQVAMTIKDMKVNGEEIDSPYEMMKEYFKNFGMNYNRNRVFDSAIRNLEDWMKRNKIQESVNEGKLPNNWMSGRTSDYHTQLRGKKREYDDTNFKKDNSGQPDLEETQAVSGGKVHKFITGKNLTLKGKKHSDIEFEVLGIDNKSQLVKLKVLFPKNLFGQEMNVPFKTIRRGPFLKTDTSNIKEGKFLTESPIFHAMNNPRFKKATSDLVKNKKVKNPETGKDVQVTTALKDKDHPAHNQAKSFFQRLKGVVKNESINESLDVKKIHNDILKFLKTKKGVEIQDYSDFPNKYGDNVSTYHVKYDIEDRFNYRKQEIKIEYSTSRVFIPNKGYFSFKTVNDIKNIINKKTTLKESVNEGCWQGYKQVGGKMKNGKMVPNCVPTNKSIKSEYASNQTLSYLPADEDEIKKMNETMIRRAVDIAQELLPKDTWARFSSDGKKNAEFVKNVVRDLTQSLNRFYKNHDISVRIKENEEDSNVDMVLGVLSILRQIDDKENRKRVAVDMIKKFKEQDIDFDYQEFIDLMKEYSMGSYEYNK